MGYRFVERTLDQFLMNVAGQPIFREPIAKGILGEDDSLVKNYDFNSFVTIVEIELRRKRAI